MEVGLGQGIRTQRLLELACRQLAPNRVLYTGIDLFEARSGPIGPGLTLKHAYRTFRKTGAVVRLYPGDPWSVFSQRANDLGPVDLLVISSEVDAKSMSKAWFYIPRMLHPDSLVFVQRHSGEKLCFRKLNPSELQGLVEAGKLPKAA